MKSVKVTRKCSYTGDLDTTVHKVVVARSHCGERGEKDLRLTRNDFTWVGTIENEDHAKAIIAEINRAYKL